MDKEDVSEISVNIPKDPHQRLLKQAEKGANSLQELKGFFKKRKKKQDKLKNQQWPIFTTEGSYQMSASALS